VIEGISEIGRKEYMMGMKYKEIKENMKWGGGIKRQE
jgi:hypothetical protein